MLNMRSVRVSDDDRRAADLTARARIRDAAIARFAEDGFDVGMRTIAADAGTSVGLVAHHFGSKSGLRAECDAHVLAVMRQVKGESVRQGFGDAAMLSALAAVEQYAPYAGYIMRTLQQGGDGARDLMAHATEDATGYLADGVANGTIVPSRDEAARTRYLVRQSLGALVLAWALDPPADGETLAAWFRRYTESIVGPALETMTEGLLADRTMLETYLAAERGTTEES